MPLGSKYEIILFRCAWSHARGRSMGYMYSLESLESVHLPYVWAPYGPCGRLTGLWTPVTARAGPVRFSKHSYVVHKSHEVLFWKQSHTVPWEPIQGLWESIRGSQACFPYGTRSGTRTTPYDCLEAFYGPKIVGSPCRKVVQAQLSATGSTVAPIRV